jgi:hypothetical protein
MESEKGKLSSEQYEEILDILRTRFEKNMVCYEGIEWENLKRKLENNKEKLWSIYEMERTGGEPDVIIYKDIAEHIFFDCSAESPKGRRSVFSDRAARELKDSLNNWYIKSRKGALMFVELKEFELNINKHFKIALNEIVYITIEGEVMYKLAPINKSGEKNEEVTRNPRPIEVKAGENYKLLVKFENGALKIVNVEELLKLPSYAKLKNDEFFKQAKVEKKTVYWDDEIYIDPDYLYENGIEVNELLMASENTLSKDWLDILEEKAWEDL